jgi:hypothetical protein
MLEKVTLLVSVLINASAVIVGVRMEINRRRLESNRTRLEDRRMVYAGFMSKIVKWQHLVVIEHDLRNPTDQLSKQLHAEALSNLRLARQEAMEPLFELRMLGNPEVVRIGEKVVNFNYDYEREYGSYPKDMVQHPEWVKVRDEFITAVRKELGSDSM